MWPYGISFFTPRKHGLKLKTKKGPGYSPKKLSVVFFYFLVYTFSKGEGARYLLYFTLGLFFSFGACA